MDKPTIRVVEEGSDTLTLKGSGFSSSGEVIVSDCAYIQESFKELVLQAKYWSEVELVVLKKLEYFKYYQTVYLHIKTKDGAQSSHGYPIIFR